MTRNGTTTRTTRRLLVVMLKGVGTTLLLVSCALLIYLGAVALARLSAWLLFP